MQTELERQVERLWAEFERFGKADWSRAFRFSETDVAPPESQTFFIMTSSTSIPVEQIDAQLERDPRRDPGRR